MQRQAEPFKGVLVGALAGLAGGLVMNQFQSLWSKLTEDESHSEHAHPPRQYVSQRQLEGQQQSEEEDEPATVKVADAISQLRTAGWLAQWEEMLLDAEQKIARPRQIYLGYDERDYVPMEARGDAKSASFTTAD